jgi:small subunit ribosomal protein S24e
MEIEILEQEENSLLHRTDVRFSVNHEEATPDRLKVRDSLAAQLDKDSAEVVVRELDTKFGMRETIGHAKVYDSPTDATEIEQDYMLERNKIAEEADAAAEGAE